MLRNYLITAFRNLIRSKSTTAINVAGLTLGVTASLILFLMVRYHTSFDQYHAKADRIYRTVHEADGNQGKNYFAGVPPAFWEAFKNDFPEAEEVAFVSYRAGDMIAVPQPHEAAKKFGDDNGIVFTQPAFFKIFDRKIIAGASSKILDEPNQAILSKKAAQKFFNRTDAVGELIAHDGKEYKVAAIMEDFPANTDFPFQVVLSYVTIKKEKDATGWNGTWSDEQCYFLLKQNTSIDEIEKRLPAFYKKYQGDKNNDHTVYHVQPLATIHSDTRYDNYNYTTVSKEKITAMLVIAVFLIITACINFINIVTAEAIRRSKEVGIRKTLGSTRTQLVAQFLGESSLVTLLSVVLAVGFAQLVLPTLNTFLKTNLSVDWAHEPQLLFFLLLLIAVVSVLAGLYPAFVVSGFKPVFAMKNLISNKNSSGYMLRRTLVVMQFVISQFLVITTLVMIRQMDYFNKKDLGFNKDAVVNIPIPENLRNGFSDGTSKMKTLREEVLKMPGIQQASLCVNAPSSGSVYSTHVIVEGKADPLGVQLKPADGRYLSLYELKLLAGKNSPDLDTAQGYIVNLKMAKLMGFQRAEDALGIKIKPAGRNFYLPVVGVVQDFHTMSLHEPIEPTMIYNTMRNYSNLSIKVNLGRFQETVKQIQKIWEASYPEHIFSYKFLDEELKEFYENEQRMSTLITVFTSIAIFIGCLGLFGLATFMANQKTKEVGVRKVMGASAESIVLLFSKEYVKLILIGFAVASPLAWYVMDQWLSTFTYRIAMDGLVFFSGLAITFVIAMATVGYRSVKSALANPVNSLKSE
ncbi:MAG: FtsX-like permease family protein [Bacteroidetes bacterium]|nr:FtsX-like permease family protein [Bacteroidota bacterium]MBS1541346.1 FtsX-like permease family protein [Bacteroidota bacterium]